MIYNCPGIVYMSTAPFYETESTSLHRSRNYKISSQFPLQIEHKGTSLWMTLNETMKGESVESILQMEVPTVSYFPRHQEHSTNITDRWVRSAVLEAVVIMYGMGSGDHRASLEWLVHLFQPHNSWIWVYSPSGYRGYSKSLLVMFCLVLNYPALTSGGWS